MWQRFTERTRRVIFFAQEEAARLGVRHVGTEHLLLGLLREPDSVAVRILERLKVDPAHIRREIDRQVARGDGNLGSEMELTPRAKRVIDLSYEEAMQLGQKYVSSEHLLLGLIREGDGIAGRVLERCKVDLRRTRQMVKAFEDGFIPLAEEEEQETNAGSTSWQQYRQGRRGGDPLERETRRIVRMALREDLTPNDLTSDLTVPADARSLAVAVAKAEGIIAGLETARQAFRQVDPSVTFEARVEDGARVSPGDEVFRAEGRSRSLLAAERTALNLLQRLSGVATETARYMQAIEGTKARVVDTRKTTPGMRLLEKYAVRVGGGRNHRTNLSDGILIKDNHIVAAGGIAAAVRRVQAEAPHTLRIEVEVTNEDEIREALEAGADALLLDNMTPEQLVAAVRLVDGRALTEASGGITLEAIRAVADSGVDLISVGALTHSVRALDISLQFRPAA